MIETFRMRKSIKHQGMFYCAIFLVTLVGYSSIFFLEEPAEYGFEGEQSVAIVGGMGLVVFGTMLILSIYTWASYYVERFTIHGTTLSIRSMLQNQQFDLCELECLAWRTCPIYGSIAFRVRGAKPRLDLNGYSEDDRLRIIQALRELVPAHLQDGWPQFCHKVALPLRDGPRSPMRSPPLASTHQGHARVVGMGIWLAVPLLGLGLLWWGVEATLACLIGCILMGVAIPLMLYLAHKADQQRRLADERGAKEAPEKWIKGQGEEVAKPPSAFVTADRRTLRLRGWLLTHAIRYGLPRNHFACADGC